MPVARDMALTSGFPALSAVFSHRPAQAAGPFGGPDLSSLGDEALMQRWQNGDLRAFQALYRRNGASLHRYLLRMTRTQPEAEELFQDVWLAVVRAHGGWRPEASFRTFLFTIANRRLTDRLRKRSRRMGEIFAFPIEDAADQLISSEPDPAAAADAADLGRALMVAIAALPEAQRQAFLLQVEGGLSLEEIAEATGAPTETVKSRLRYARQRLREALGEYRPEDSGDD